MVEVVLEWVERDWPGRSRLIGARRLRNGKRKGTRSKKKNKAKKTKKRKKKKKTASTGPASSFWLSAASSGAPVQWNSFPSHSLIYSRRFVDRWFFFVFVFQDLVFLLAFSWCVCVCVCLEGSVSGPVEALGKANEKEQKRNE